MNIRICLLFISFLIACQENNDKTNHEFTSDTLQSLSLSAKVECIKIPQVRLKDTISNRADYIGYINGMGIVDSAKGIDMNYTYLIIHKKDSTLKFWKDLCIILKKNNKIVSELFLGEISEGLAVHHFSINNKYHFNNVDEVFNVIYSVPACGFTYYQSLVFRKRDQLLNAFITTSEGETDYHNEDFILPENGFLTNEVWLSVNTGFSMQITETGKTIQVANPDMIKKYRYINDSFHLVNSEQQKENIMYVTNSSGLKIRTAPNIESQSIHLLKKGEKVYVYKTTSSDSLILKYEIIENSQTIKGNWVWATAKYSNNIYSGFIFDGYLSKQKPE